MEKRKLIVNSWKQKLGIEIAVLLLSPTTSIKPVYLNFIFFSDINFVSLDPDTDASSSVYTFILCVVLQNMLTWVCLLKIPNVLLIISYNLWHIQFCILIVMMLNFTGGEVETETTEPSHTGHEDLWCASRTKRHSYLKF